MAAGTQSAYKGIYVEANDPSLVYWPSLDYWIPDSGPQRIANGSLVDDYFHADDYRSSDFLGASVSLTFNGSYIAYYCDLYPSHGTTEASSLTPSAGP